MVFPIVTYSYESWTIKKAVPKNWYFWTVVLKKTLESSLDSKEIKPVNLKGNQPWILIGRTDAKAEAPILWPPDAKSRLIGKDPDAGKDWSQKEKRVTGWNGWMASPMQWTWTWASSGRRWGTGKPGVLQGCEELDTTWRLNSNNNLTKWMKWEIENLNRSIATYENGSMDQNLTPLKILQSKIVYMHILPNFHWMDHIYFILCKLFQRSEQEK